MNQYQVAGAAGGYGSSSSNVVGSDKKDKILVAAIDFGTTFSGYAFSFKHDYQADPSKVSVNQNWVAGSMALVSLKAPTVVLFDENKKFLSFGYEAENAYSELALDGEHHKYYYYKRFKMRLHEKKVSEYYMFVFLFGWRAIGVCLDKVLGHKLKRCIT